MKLLRRTRPTRHRTLRRRPCADCHRLAWALDGAVNRCGDCTPAASGPVPTLSAATASARVALVVPASERRSLASPSPLGVRPWGLRRVEPAGDHALRCTTGWRYDRGLQVTVDARGRPVAAADPTAHSVTSGDGDEGPSEDWSYDFCPDELPGV